MLFPWKLNVHLDDVHTGVYIVTESSQHQIVGIEFPPDSSPHLLEDEVSSTIEMGEGSSIHAKLQCQVSSLCESSDCHVVLILSSIYDTKQCKSLYHISIAFCVLGMQASLQMLQISRIRTGFGGILRPDVVSHGFYDRRHGICWDSRKECFGEDDGMSIVEVVVVEFQQFVMSQGYGSRFHQSWGRRLICTKAFRALLRIIFRTDPFLGPMTPS